MEEEEESPSASLHYEEASLALAPGSRQCYPTDGSPS